MTPGTVPPTIPLLPWSGGLKDRRRPGHPRFVCLTVMRFALIIGVLRLARLRVNAGTLTIEEWQEIR